MNFFKSLFASANKDYANVDAPTFLKLIETTEDAVILDVRTPAEYASGKIKGAINLDIFAPTFMDAVNKLDKNKTYLVYCRSGNRSGQACSKMAKQGFEKLYNLSGGIISL
ncbi:MAG: rhodanese-like domain-containing protein [Saprospiraceae bacterium]